MPTILALTRLRQRSARSRNWISFRTSGPCSHGWTLPAAYLFLPTLGQPLSSNGRVATRHYSRSLLERKSQSGPLFHNANGVSSESGAVPIRLSGVWAGFSGRVVAILVLWRCALVGHLPTRQNRSRLYPAVLLRREPRKQMLVSEDIRYRSVSDRRRKLARNATCSSLASTFGNCSAWNDCSGYAPDW